MIKTLKNKFLFLTIGMLIALCVLVTSVSFIEYSINKKLKKQNCNTSVAYFAEKIKISTQHLQEDAIDMAIVGELLYKEKAIALNHKNLDFATKKVFEKETLPIGGGIWFEPSVNNGKRLCSYAYKKDNQVITDTINFESDAYNYVNQMWYKTLKNQVSQTKSTAWTKPYYDTSGTHSLMTTVGAGIYDKHGQVIGLATADWDLNDIIKDLTSLTPTENSFVLFADDDDDFIIGTTDVEFKNQNIIGKSLKNITWYRPDLRNGQEIKYKNKKYITFKQQLAENGMVLFVNVPKSELFAGLRNYLKFSLGLLYLISILMAGAIFSLLIKHISKPIQYLIKTAEEIGDGNLDEEIKINSPEEFAKLAYSFNKMTKNVKSHLFEINKIKMAQNKLQQELDIAKSIQHSVLPNKFPAYPNRKEFDIFASMKTSKKVGGDFYDFFFMDDNHLLFLIADVSGKGIPAALFMMHTLSLIKNAAKAGYNAGQILTRVNKKICENNPENLFVTVFLGILNTETGEINCVNAGHNPPIKKTKNNAEYLLIEPDLVLGVDENILYTNHTINLEKDSILFLYTDGITEAMNKNEEFFGEHRLANALKNPEQNLQMLSIIVQSEVEEFMQNTEQADDITMLALKYKDFKTENTTEQKSRRLVISAKRKNLDAVNYWLKTICDEELLSIDLHNKLMLVMEEIFVNVANYAYPPKDGDIEIIFSKLDDNLLEFKFIDTGMPFNPLEKEEPDINLSAEERPVGGLGIFLVKNIMDNIEYEYRNNQNILTTTIRF